MVPAGSFLSSLLQLANDLKENCCADSTLALSEDNSKELSLSLLHLLPEKKQEKRKKQTPVILTKDVEPKGVPFPSQRNSTATGN